ncbi:MAG: aldehyde ferredoxin oxidoreductase family protein [Chloroflexota bacterium]|nr:aldehyde ferredoxin oxidoreductase family protein [Chloroflexota bacterium]
MSAFPYAGYADRYLRVNLTSGEIQSLPMPVEWVEEFLGGNGIGTKILWDEVPPETDPLGPDNKLIVATGPLCGGLMPNASRLEFIAKSPLTGIYGDSNAGGHFGPELKFAGYNLIVLEGSAATPVYLLIRDDKVELRDAAHLWGKGGYETERMIQKENRDPKIKTAVIGQAGENQVRMASIMVTWSRHAARGGLGAVMGAKKVKAIAVRGTRGLRIADQDAHRAIAFKMHSQIRSNEFFTGVQRFGTPGLVSLMNPMGRFPTKNFQYGNFDGFEDISGETLREEHLVRDISCFNCPVGCDKVYSVESGEFKGIKVGSVEYETLNSLGSAVMNRNLPAVLKGNQLCDDWGLDTISAGRAISFAMELFEKGVLSEAECDGLDLSWGNYHTVLELLRRITFREGKLGDLLAEGAARAAKITGRGADRFAMHVKGQDIPAQDGRAQQSMGLAHVTSSRGADHLKAFPIIDETGYPSEAVRRYGEQYMPELVDPLATRYKALLVKDGEDFGAVVDSAGNCKSGGTFVMAEVYWQEQAEAIQTMTGMRMDAEKLKTIGERIYNLQRCYNILHGISQADDVLPWRFTQKPSPSGNATGSVCRIDLMLPEYYSLRGWDAETGFPFEETLERLGLADAEDRVQKSVVSGAAQAVYDKLGWATPYTGPVMDDL